MKNQICYLIECIIFVTCEPVDGVHFLEEALDPSVDVHSPLSLLELEHSELPFFQWHLQGSVQSARNVARLIRIGLKIVAQCRNWPKTCCPMQELALNLLPNVGIGLKLVAQCRNWPKTFCPMQSLA